jgi:predicted DNA-binding protein
MVVQPLTTTPERIMGSVLHMKINNDLKEKLQELAKQDNRTLTNYVETILKRHLEEEKKHA